MSDLYMGDCREIRTALPDNSVDTIITDPPYGLEFMGKGWDKGVPGVEFWREFLAVAKPGAMLLAFGGTRTFHRMTCAIEDAGWEIRDCLMWLYGSGFPKSLDISKAIDKKDGRLGWKSPNAGNYGGDGGGLGSRPGNQHRTEAFDVELESDLAKQWSGWGTALKPAWEPIILAMKPIDGTFAQNAEKWGVAGINVDGGRIACESRPMIERRNDKTLDGDVYGSGINGSRNLGETSKGRWPANLLLDEDAAAMLDEQSGDRPSSFRKNGSEVQTDERGTPFGNNSRPPILLNDSGGASRFFYVAKASKSERNAGCEAIAGGCSHPTVKPLKLMEYLCTLSKTPTGGVVLDPFAGSGTTLLAAKNTGREYIGIEQNPEYFSIIKARLGVA